MFCVWFWTNDRLHWEECIKGRLPISTISNALLVNYFYFVDKISNIFFYVYYPLLSHRIRITWSRTMFLFSDNMENKTKSIKNNNTNNSYNVGFECWIDVRLGGSLTRTMIYSFEISRRYANGYIFVWSNIETQHGATHLKYQKTDWEWKKTITTT